MIWVVWEVWGRSVASGYGRCSFGEVAHLRVATTHGECYSSTLGARRWTAARTLWLGSIVAKGSGAR
eukprot:4185352-Amphidinium_carterae.1